MGEDHEGPGGRDASTSFSLRTPDLIPKHICTTLADIDELILDDKDESGFCIVSVD